MTSPLKIDLSELATWFLRLSRTPGVKRRLTHDPVFFASWYTQVFRDLEFPLEVQAIQERERDSPISLNDALNLLQKLDRTGAAANKTSGVKRVLEGYAVHEWVRANPDAFEDLLLESAETAKALILDNEESATCSLQQFSADIGLCDLEGKLFKVAFVCSAFPEFQAILESAFGSKGSDRLEVLSELLATPVKSLREALSAEGVLRKSRLVHTDKVKGTPYLRDFWVRAIVEDPESLLETLVAPFNLAGGSGMPARLSKEDHDLATEIVKNASSEKALGVNLLLYGQASFDMKGQLSDLIDDSGVAAYALSSATENASEELGSIVYVAQRLLSKKVERGVLVIDSPATVLERRPSDFLRSLLGNAVETGRIQPLDELLLETNPLVTIWTGPGVDRLTEECISRFVFHAPLKRGSKEDRRQQLLRCAQDLKLSRATQKALLGLEDVSAKQLEVAMRAAQLSGASSKPAREQALVHAVHRSLTALKRDTAPAAKECVTDYSLKYLNYSGKFGPEQILKALTHRPKGTLCLYGPPGTGKTQFVEYLAQKLGTRLISKRASDLLSKWVGENEKNISEMFIEAEASEAILFLDEGDSFLADRSTSSASWEVSRVNELLQGMERFNGIFIVATNLFKGLDAAALRRFTFKMELRALRADQRWDMFVQETSLKGNLSAYSKAQKDSWRGTLSQLNHLSAGDFATVKRQCVLLGESLSPAQWIEQLQIECDIKSGGDAPATNPPEVPAPPRTHLH